MWRASFFLLSIFLVSPAWSYPEFIGYGYGSCITCHYSGAGSGGLNDYGRALFAAEIAAKPFGMNIDDEKLAESSQFLGKIQSPYWLKPGIKYRRLYNEINPGSTNKMVRYYTMQVDLNLASFTNEDQTMGVISTFSHIAQPSMGLPNKEMREGSQLMAKEYYLRWQASEHSWWYFGFFDKATGIRQPDHTSVSRSALKAGQNDQVHGLMWQWQKEKHELFVNPFVGNTHLSEDQQSKGLSILYEYEKMERLRYGGSIRSESTTNEKFNTAAGLIRMGIEKGHALLWELGLKNQKLGSSDATLGAYQFLEFNYLLTRGMNFQSIMQYERTDFKSEYSDGYRWGFGFVYFPAQRIELRTQALQRRTQARESVRNDEWVGQGQLHLSL